MAKKYIAGYRAQTRERMVKYTVSTALLLLLIAVLQSAGLAHLREMGALPDLMLCTVLTVGFFFGPFAGAITGIGGGWLIEALGSTGISILPIVYLLVGYLCGYFAKSAVKSYPAYLIHLLIALLVRAATTLAYACMSCQYIDLPKILLTAVLPELLSTALCGCLLYFPLKAFCAAVEKK